MTDATIKILRLFALAFAGWPALAAAADSTPPKLSLPIRCEPGKTCFIQSYVDIDTGPEWRDFACGSATYEGHKGTDFRVLSSAAAAQHVAVLASADGMVKGQRDGMDDILIDELTKGMVAARECGNGVVIDHGAGWETQYCHMLKGSVRVKAGDKVTRGQPLGDVGNSGLAQFAHVHLEVRKDGKPVEPFSGRSQDAACSLDAKGNGGLWTDDAAKAFPYANGQLIGVSFAARAPSKADLEINHEPAPPRAGASEIYFVARIANIRIGDRVKMTLTGPGGFKFQNESKPLDRNRPIHLEFATAKTNSGGPLPPGTFVGKAELIRGGAVLGTRDGEFEYK